MAVVMVLESNHMDLWSVKNGLRITKIGLRIKKIGSAKKTGFVNIQEHNYSRTVGTEKITSSLQTFEKICKDLEHGRGDVVELKITHSLPPPLTCKIRLTPPRLFDDITTEGFIVLHTGPPCEKQS